MTCVSVILPNYNHEKYLEERIESILAQTFQDFELIIMDDCSTDQSIKVLEKYKYHPKVSQFIINKTNTGSTFSQWNYGVSLAKGKYIWIAESDDIAKENLLESLVLVLDKNPDVVLAYCQSLQIDEHRVINGSWYEWTKVFGEKNIFSEAFIMNGEEFIETYMLYRNVIPNASAVIFRKKTYNEVGGGLPLLRYTGDWYLWVKLLSKGNIFFSNKELNFFRRHQTSVIYKSVLNNSKPELVLKSNLMLNKFLLDFFTCFNNEKLRYKYYVLYRFSQANFLILSIMFMRFSLLIREKKNAELNNISIMYYVFILLGYYFYNLIRFIFKMKLLEKVYFYLGYFKVFSK
ncbi:MULTISPECIES: glycosyltransferase [Acinetobacter]|uniref:Glycosyltransferase family 2 protein n=1 Tax=Acinetobacter corruptisaponis TaxID=3045147 RepID=A0ABY8RZX2_9GAMM|nr:glycosyltransferase [Acinetobacter sp. KCTC 92772]WHP04862.1 glycosyltransferase family 2 protein [Acinetobacter sp. KCTC 92772]